MSRFLISTLSLVLLVTFVADHASAQANKIKASDKALAVVPEGFRAQLIERLNLYLEYNRTRQYDKLYDLMYVPDSESREDFVKACLKGDVTGYGTRVIKFKMREISKGISGFLDSEPETDANNKAYDLYGASTVRQGEETSRSDNVVLHVKWRNGDWYFGNIGIITYD